MRVKVLRLVAVFLAVTTISSCNLINSFKPSDDKAIVTGVQSKLYQDPVLKSRNIQVVSEKGVVVLTGDVNTELERAAAGRLAGEVSGVKQVINQLNIPTAPAATSAPPEQTMTAENNPPPPVAEHKTPERKKHTSGQASAAPRQKPSPTRNEDSAPSPSPQPEPAPPAPVQTATAPPAPPVAVKPPPPRQIDIPEGTTISVRMIDPIDSARNRPGDEFAASLAAPVVVGDRVIIPEGSDARVRLVEAATAGRMKGQSELQVELIEVSAYGTPYSVQSTTYRQAGASRGKNTAEKVGAGAVLGGLIGAIAGKGKGAAIGAGIGAAGGAGVQAATKAQQVKIPPETKIEFTLRAPFTVTLPN